LRQRSFGPAPQGQAVAERLQLVQEIWDSVAPSVEQLPLTQVQREQPGEEQVVTIRNERKDAA
jgi:hypothetical protein